MRILDRQRYAAFARAYLICFIALVGLVIIIDAFANLDEFSEVASGTEFFSKIGRYYLIRMSLFYDRLSGVIAMMAAVFTATWMQRNNELIAMLSAGLGTKRIIRPILVAGILVNLLAIANQELVLPIVGDELQKTPDDFDGIRIPESRMRSRLDLNGISIGAGGEGIPNRQLVTRFHAFLPIPEIRGMGSIEASEAIYIPEDDQNAPEQGGWLLRRARVMPSNAPIPDDVLISIDDPALLEEFPESLDGMHDIGGPGESMFLKSNVTFQTITRDPRQWFRYVSTMELLQAIVDPANEPDVTEISVFLHSRVVRPFLGMALMFITMPLILGGTSRNTFINLGFSIATSAMFYGMLSVSQYLGSTGIVSPVLAAWLPLFVFAPLAALRWDDIKS